MAKQNQKSSKFLTGALVGAMLGIAVGVLAETKTGKKLAKQAKGKSGEFYKYINGWNMSYHCNYGIC